MRFVWLVAVAVNMLSATAQGQSLADRVQQLDGLIARQEQRQSTIRLQEDETLISVRLEGDVFWVRVQSEPLNVASLCLGTPDSVMILHASSALGWIPYRRNGSAWQRNGSFNWDMRNTSMTQEALRARARYFNQNGWVATTVEMGQRGEVEFLIRRDLLPADTLYLAAGLMPTAHPDEIMGFPVDTAGDCADPELVTGPPDPTLHFNPTAWAKLVEEN